MGLLDFTGSMLLLEASPALAFPPKKQNTSIGLYPREAGRSGNAGDENDMPPPGHSEASEENLSQNDAWIRAPRTKFLAKLILIKNFCVSSLLIKVP